MQKKYPAGTTAEQWERYEKKLAEFEARMYSKEPKPEDHDEATYKKLKSAWDMEFFCDAPNEPGYYRANND